jgi:uncharacterized protein with FMN-binding domain
MKRITFWLLSTVSVVVLLFGYDASHASTTPPTSIVSGSKPVASGGTTSGAASSGSAGGSAKSSGTSGGSSSTTTKTVTGSVASTQWGPVQVQLTVKSGRITKVDVLQQPNGNPRDDQINSYALPILTQETLQDQNSNIDMVSGATVTSTGYLQSLQSALDQANL